MFATSTTSVLCDQYLDRLAFGWQRRQGEVLSHVLDFAALNIQDNILTLSAQALSEMNETAGQLIQRKLQDPLMAGEFFALTWYALQQGSKSLQNACIGLVQAVPTLRAAYAAALEWASPQQVWVTLELWSNAKKSNHEQTVALSDTFTLLAAIAHPVLFEQLCGSPRWQNIAQHHDASLLTRIAVMECAQFVSDHQSLERAAAAGLQAQNSTLQRLAAQAILYRPWQSRTNLQGQALHVLQTQALSDHPLAKESLLALACWHFFGWEEIMPKLAQQESQRSLYLQALGWRGNVTSVEELIEYLDHPEHARIAGAALSMLTGSLPAHDSWLHKPDDDKPTAQKKAYPNANSDVDDANIPAAKQHADLPQPDKAAFKRWWATHAQRFSASKSFLGGLPETPENLYTTLRTGKQAWREVAALKLQARQHGPRLQTTAPSKIQLQWLATHSPQGVIRERTA